MKSLGFLILIGIVRSTESKGVVSVVSTCLKFANNPNRGTIVTINGICYYPFTNQLSYTDAQTACKSEATRLAIIDTVVEQSMLNSMIGFFLSEYWIGLEYRINGWYWVDGSNTYLMADPRWSEIMNVSMAYATGAGVTWNMKSSMANNFYLCEDEHSPPTVTVPVNPTTTQEFLCIAKVGATNVSKLSTKISISVIDCARTCVIMDHCVYFQYQSHNDSCNGYSAGDGDSLIGNCFECL